MPRFRMTNHRWRNQITLCRKLLKKILECLTNRADRRHKVGQVFGVIQHPPHRILHHRLSAGNLCKSASATTIQCSTSKTMFHYYTHLHGDIPETLNMKLH